MPSNGRRGEQSRSQAPETPSGPDDPRPTEYCECRKGSILRSSVTCADFQSRLRRSSLRHSWASRDGCSGMYHSDASKSKTDELARFFYKTCFSLTLLFAIDVSFVHSILDNRRFLPQLYNLHCGQMLPINTAEGRSSMSENGFSPPSPSSGRVEVEKVHERVQQVHEKKYGLPSLIQSSSATIPLSVEIEMRLASSNKFSSPGSFE